MGGRATGKWFGKLAGVVSIILTLVRDYTVKLSLNNCNYKGLKRMCNAILGAEPLG